MIPIFVAWIDVIDMIDMIDVIDISASVSAWLNWHRVVGKQLIGQVEIQVLRHRPV